MRAVFAIALTVVLALTLVVRATPRACGSTFACYEAPKVTKTVSPCCEKVPTPAHDRTHHSDEPMACCMPLTMPATVDAFDVAEHALVGDGAGHVERSVITHSLEPATPPPRTIA